MIEDKKGRKIYSNSSRRNLSEEKMNEDRKASLKIYYKRKEENGEIGSEKVVSDDGGIHLIRLPIVQVH